MAYCDVTDVQGRAGSLLDNLTSNPTVAEVGAFIDQAAATIDGYVAGARFAVPVTNPVVLGSIAPMNIDGALVLALEARFNATRGPGAEPSPLLAGARARWMAAMKQMASGTHPALIALRAESTGLAGSFGADEAAGYWPDALTEGRPLNVNTDAVVYEGMPL